MWYCDRASLVFIGRRYLPWMMALNLAWEILQLPLYTIWREASPGYIAFAVVHCTAGDLLVAAAALVASLIVLRAGPLSRWPWLSLSLISTLLGVAYTALSEWLNTSITRSWEYSQLMPAVHLGGVALGLSPLLQWLVLPPLAFYLARRQQKPAMPPLIP